MARKHIPNYFARFRKTMSRLASDKSAGRRQRRHLYPSADLNASRHFHFMRHRRGAVTRRNHGRGR